MPPPAEQAHLERGVSELLQRGLHHELALVLGVACTGKGQKIPRKISLRRGGAGGTGPSNS